MNANNLESSKAREAPAQPLESPEAALARLAQSVEVVPAMDDKQEDGLTLAVLIRASHDGEDVMLAAPAVPEMLIDPNRTPQERMLFEKAKSFMWQEPVFANSLLKADGRWWAGTRFGSAVDRDLLESMEAGDNSGKLDVMNCSKEVLSTDEVEAIEYVLSAVATYTGSKIFDRVSGIVLLDESHIPRTADQIEEDKHTLGSYQNAYGVIGINMSYIRQHAYELTERYKPYFDGRPINLLQVVLAHELGHAMDIRTLDESNAHSIDKTNMNWSGFGAYTDDFSSFQQGLGWESEIVKNENGWDDNEWHREDDVCQEVPPTDYAFNPREDFAETFAILALNGDSSELTIRQHKIADTLSKAEGHRFTGPRKIEVKKRSPYSVFSPGGRLKKINLIVGQ